MDLRQVTVFTLAIIGKKFMIYTTNQEMYTGFSLSKGGARSIVEYESFTYQLENQL